MEVKKTEKASLKGNNILYFLGGLNVVLLVVLGLFSYQHVEREVVVEEIQEPVEAETAILIDIPEPETPPPPPPPENEPPPPPPPPIPTEIEETPEPVPPPPIAKQEIKVPDVPTGPVNTGPVKKVDLSGLNKKAKAAPKEERVSEPVSVNRVQDMAVYPGCEKHRGNKRQLIKCFGEELQGDILRYLDTEFPDTDKKQVAVQLEFHVTPEGYITNISPKRGDNEFKPQAKEALERAAAYLKRKGKKIEPAKFADGSKATLIFNNSVVLQNPN